MPTPVTYYVNTASTPGGDGTTNATSGATRAFASLNAAEAATQRNLVAADEVLTIICMGTAADTTQTDIAGWTTDATRRLIIKTDVGQSNSRHAGVWSTSHYRLEATYNTIHCFENDVEIDGLQIFAGKSTNDNSHIGINFDSVVRCRVKNCLIKLDTAAQTSFGNNCVGISLGTDIAGKMEAYNNIIYDFDRSTNVGIRAVNFTSDNGYIYHNTIYNCTTGISDGYSDLIAKNNLVYNCGTDFSGSFNASSNYNVTDGGSAPGANSKTSQTITFAGAADFHTDDTDAQVSNNLYADAGIAVTDDIDGDARPSSGDVFAGADEGTTSSPGDVTLTVLTVAATLPGATAGVAAEGGFFDLLGIVGFLAGASGTPGGVTLSALTVSASVPGATATGAGSTTLAALNLVSSTQATSETGAASVTLGALDLASSVQATSETGAANVSLAALDVISSAQATTETGAAVVSLTALDVVVSAQAPSTGVPGDVSLPVLTVAASVPGATATGQGTASLAALTVTAATQATSETGAARVSLAALELASSVQATTETGAANTTLGALTVAVSEQTATATSTAAGEVTLSVLTVSASLPGAAATGKASTSLAALNVTSSVQGTTETGAATVTLSPQILTASAQAPATAGKALVTLSAIDLVSSLPGVTPSGKAAAALAVLSVSSLLRDATAAGALLATEGLGTPIAGSNKFTAAASYTDDTLEGSAKNTIGKGSTRETVSGSNRQVIVRRY